MGAKAARYLSPGLLLIAAVWAVALIAGGRASASAVDIACHGAGTWAYAPASPRGQWCHAGGAGFALWIPVLGLGLGVLVLRLRKPHRAVVFTFLATAALAATPFVLTRTLPRNCTGQSSNVYETSACR